ncbi:hypothetical protein LTR36_005783 [Oleoguttula mirabilis]|uniref:BTB domain-containing protein n=1 Tax=Oleoguttula mirabilis TaxID=1507867 RepID=A0AAV9JD94_9PEZI|nr:hypothetical protein LTR36_005783 [Oleoguttula mirabilis]
MPQYRAISFEELRLNDCISNRGLRSLANEGPSTQPSQHNKLVEAHIPTIGFNAWPITSPRTLLSLRPPEYGTSIIIFEVGKERPERFALHENLITPRSDFVRMALSKEWKEGQERTIPLPEDDADVFRAYHLWIYHNRIFSDKRTDTTPFQGSLTTIAQEDGTEYPLLIQAYILGEKLLDTHFKDAVIDCIIDKLRTTRTFDVRLTNLIYDNTPEKSPLRRLLQDVYIWSGNAAWLDEELLGEYVNAEFVLDLGKRHMAFWGGHRPEKVPYLDCSCGYHEHVKGVCYRAVYS